MENFPAEKRKRLPLVFHEAACAAVDKINELQPERNYGPGSESMIYLGCVLWKAIDPEAYERAGE